MQILDSKGYSVIDSTNKSELDSRPDDDSAIKLPQARITITPEHEDKGIGVYRQYS